MRLSFAFVFFFSLLEDVRNANIMMTKVKENLKDYIEKKDPKRPLSDLFLTVEPTIHNRTTLFNLIVKKTPIPISGQLSRSVSMTSKHECGQVDPYSIPDSVW